MDRHRLAILLDPHADDDARLDIARQLRSEANLSSPPAWADDDEVLDGLTQLASDEDEGWLHNDAAETLALLWVGRGRVDSARFRRLSSNAQDEVRAYFKANELDFDER